ncbi:MAG TPA: carbohydrate kinase family protein [Polyangiaceae bacterium]|nr:carbohydrate kinase family protein [Polyangiaceae bacterium]
MATPADPSDAPLDVYVYGMTVLSTIHRLTSAPSDFDGYAEIAESRVCPGGEGMNAALLLASLGLRVGLGGPHWGTETAARLERYARRHAIDVSSIERDDSFPGVMDVVLVGGGRRLVLGAFQRFFSEERARWSEPSEASIRAARVVAIDPFFRESSERAAELSTRYQKPYVTIDCAYDGLLHSGARVNVVSREFRNQRYPSVDEQELFGRYVERARSGGLVIFTSGSEPIQYWDGARSLFFQPYRVDAKSTLGAGDVFRAGVVFGVQQGLEAAECVRFAAGLSALMCTRFPIADELPTRDDVERFLRERP